MERSRTEGAGGNQPRWTLAPERWSPTQSEAARHPDQARPGIATLGPTLAQPRSSDPPYSNKPRRRARTMRAREGPMPRSRDDHSSAPESPPHRPERPAYSRFEGDRLARNASALAPPRFSLFSARLERPGSNPVADRARRRGGPGGPGPARRGGADGRLNEMGRAGLPGPGREVQISRNDSYAIMTIPLNQRLMRI